MRRLARLQHLPPADFTTPISYIFRRLPHCVGATLVVITCIYVLSPYVALWSLNNALRQHDAQTLASYVDWSSLSTSLKQQTLAQIAKPPPADGDLPDFGSSFASGAVSHAIDTRLTPTTILDLASRFAPTVSVASLGTSDLFWKLSAHFVSPTRFEAGMITTPGHPATIVHMKFEHWHWKITRLEMPHAI